MATDARIMTGLPTHPKTRKLVRRHGQAAAWNLICLFLFARENKPDGDFTGMTAEDIELAADWMGEPGEFVAALVDIRYLDETENGYLIHDWAEHNPWAAGAKKRSESAQRNAAKRWQKRYGIDADGIESDAVGINPHSEPNDFALQSAQNGNAPSPSPLPTPYPSPSPTPNEKQKEVPPASQTATAPSAKKGTRLSADWKPSDDLLAWAKAERPDLNLSSTVETFIDYWVAKPGKDGTKLDWNRTFKVWVRGEKSRPVDPKQNVVRPISTRPAPETPEQKAERKRREQAAFELHMRNLGVQA